MIAEIYFNSVFISMRFVLSSSNHFIVCWRLVTMPICPSIHASPTTIPSFRDLRCLNRPNRFRCVFFSIFISSFVRRPRVAYKSRQNAIIFGCYGSCAPRHRIVPAARCDNQRHIFHIKTVDAWKASHEAGSLDERWSDSRPTLRLIAIGCMLGAILDTQQSFCISHKPK